MTIQEQFNITLKQNRNTILTKFNSTNQRFGYPVIKYSDVKWCNWCPFSDEPIDYSLTSNPGHKPAVTPRIVRINFNNRPFYICVSAYGRDIMVKSFKHDKQLRHIVDQKVRPILLEDDQV